LCFPGMTSSLANHRCTLSYVFSTIFLFLTFLNIHIYFIILKPYDQQFTLTTKKSLHIIFKARCNTRHVAARYAMLHYGVLGHASACCNTLQHVMVWYKALRDVMVCYGSLRYVAVPYSILRYVTARCNTLLCDTDSYGTMRCATVSYSALRCCATPVRYAAALRYIAS